jgi:hypothetical protein
MLKKIEGERKKARFRQRMSMGELKIGVLKSESNESMEREISHVLIKFLNICKSSNYKLMKETC